MTFWGLFKITLILDLIPTLCFLPIIMIIYLISPGKVNYNFDSSIETSIMTVNFGPGPSGLTGAILMGLIIWIITIIVLTAILYFLGQKTPLGEVRIGS